MADDEEWATVEKPNASIAVTQKSDEDSADSPSPSSARLSQSPVSRSSAALAASPSGGGGGSRSNNQADATSSSSQFEEKIGPLEFSRAKFDAMVAALKVAKWHDTRHQIKTISNVLSGEELCVWFISNGYVANTDEALVIGNFLIRVKILFPMLKRLAPRGFENTHDLFYMLTPEREERNVVAGFLSKAKTALTASDAALSVAANKQPVVYVAEGYQVVAFVRERERFGHLTADEKMSWAGKHLIPETDPQNFSMKPEDVPIPSVGGASPDLCEWIDEWAPLVKKGVTDDEGWVYADGFAPLSAAASSGGSTNKNSGEAGSATSPSFNIHEHRARERQWHRAARKIPDEKQIVIEEEEQETKKEYEERVHREMLQRIEQARKQRQKYYFQWTIVSASLQKQVAPATAFIVVEHFATRHRSNAVQQRISTTDPNSIDFPVNDCSGQFEVQAEQIVGVAVWANLSMGRKAQLGYASFCIPGGAAGSSGGAAAAAVAIPTEMQEEAADVVDKQNKTIGTVKFEWQMTPIPMDDTAMDLENTKPGSLLHTPHCVLELSIVQIQKVDFRLLDRSRGSRYKCLAFFMPSGEPKAFLRIKYRGLVSNMVLESPRVLLTETTRFDFTTFLPVRHLVPIAVELWYERGAPGEMTQEHIGEIKLEFVRSGLEMISNEKPVITPIELSRGMYQAAMDMIPADKKPPPPPVPANPVLEELISFQEQLRRSQQARKEDTIYGTGGGASPTAAAAASSSEKNDDAKSNSGAATAADAKNASKSGAIVMPTMLTKTCEMMLRYKYVVEGEQSVDITDLDELTKKDGTKADAKKEGGTKKEGEAKKDDKKVGAVVEEGKPSAEAAKP